ncbi:MAG: hypothetical protein ONB12_03710 [candidate division KSB1 bacterium]|nr:hypothetical protein [candidate division KSB1 bacterium]
MYTPIQLDKVRNFRYGMKAMHLIEQKMKQPISKIDFDNLTMNDLATILWAGLVHEDPKLTTEKVMDLVDEYSSLVKVTKAMDEAFRYAMGESDEERAEEKN